MRSRDREKTQPPGRPGREAREVHASPVGPTSAKPGAHRQMPSDRAPANGPRSHGAKPGSVGAGGGRQRRGSQAGRRDSSQATAPGNGAAAAPPTNGKRRTRGGGGGTERGGRGAKASGRETRRAASGGGPKGSGPHTGPAGGPAWGARRRGGGPPVRQPRTGPRREARKQTEAGFLCLCRMLATWLFCVFCVSFFVCTVAFLFAVLLCLLSRQLSVCCARVIRGYIVL